MKDKVLYIYTARDGRARTRELIVSHNYRCTISGSLEIVALLLPLKYTHNSESRLLTRRHVKTGQGGRGVQSLK